MNDRRNVLPWERPDWLDQARNWIAAELARHSIILSGAIEQQHVRPWSSVLRVPTERGSLYFKATAAALAYEPALTMRLAAWRPDCMPQVLAIDTIQSWMLMIDSGPTLRSLLQNGEGLEHWQRVLPLYAELQIEMAARRAQLLAAGASDARLATLPHQYERLLADRAALRLGEPEGLSEQEYRRLVALQPRFAELCSLLADYDLPETLYHDDFHDGNIAVLDYRYRFFDWGESCVGHPFMTLVVALRSIAFRFSLQPDDPVIERLLNTYLEPWTRFLPRNGLRAAAQLARCIGTVGRALTWDRVLAGAPERLRAEYAEAVPGWLQEFLVLEEQLNFQVRR